MKIGIMSACVLFLLFLAFGAAAKDLAPVRTSDPQATIHGGNPDFAKVSGDTIDLMGPAGPYKGDFEASVDGALCDGWTSVDITQPTATHWSLETVNNDLDGINGISMWDGEFFDACSSQDSAWGYDNSWHDLVVWSHDVDDVNSSTTITVHGNLYYDSEPGYDYTYLSYKVGNQLGYIDQASYNPRAKDTNGDPAAVTVDEPITYEPGEYVNGKVMVYFRFQSDGGWSDGDCSWPTRGAANVDEITMSWVNGAYSGSTFDDFESGWGNWAITYPHGVGDFAHVWEGLRDVDPCSSNLSKQVAFIDDGIVVPGTGGSQCMTWCYGPNGYIVNPHHGIADSNERIHNAIESPVMPWPNADYDGILYAFDVYRHSDLFATSPPVFYTWSIRSADTDAGQDITTQPWLDRNYVYWGAPKYLRVTNDVTDLMVPGRDEIQLQATVYLYDFIGGWFGYDGTPAPYFDNFNVKVFPYLGPSITANEVNLAQDNFPATGTIDMTDPGALSVRFDAAKNILINDNLHIDPGDSIVCSIVPVRAGSLLEGPPVLHWTLRPNHLFDAYRTSSFGTSTTGAQAGVPAVGSSGIPSSTQWAFDLPDTAFLYPGDVLHYYIEASDDVGGDVLTVTLPADLTGYGDFSHSLAYDSSFVVHCLPTITSDGFGGYKQPRILFLNDYANLGGQDEWYGAFDNNGLRAGVDFDIYYTNAPSSHVDNGIGGRATDLQIADYDEIFYTCGDLSIYTIINRSAYNASDDVGLLTRWLESDGKDMFLTGDGLASDLYLFGSGPAQNFLNNHMGLDLVVDDIRPLIGGQATPVVKAVPGNGVIVNQPSWVAYGGCPGINTFDAVTTRSGAVRLAEFTDPAGNTGAYNFSAATLMAQANGSRVVSMPYDFKSIYNDPDAAKIQAPLSVRAEILNDILGFFGVDWTGEVTPVPDSMQFTAQAYPNPFNPQTTIKFTMPQKGPVSVKIFNLRGELVKALVDEVRPAGDNSAKWDGTSNAGSSVSSGVYFYEARCANEVQVGKLTMIK